MIMAMFMAINVSEKQPTCMPAITSLSPCLNFISGNGTTAAPSPVCCSQLASVLSSQAQCLCSVLIGVAGAPAATPAISMVGATADLVTMTTPSVSSNQSPATPSVPSNVPAAAGLDGVALELLEGVDQDT
ncbi:hypothetical protein J5N97_022786 [Dioscorea zingiberensis]|uniref:Bifunctional inhibitor/plant lipid transfer protein/seed storage helical domain-containing protein n=1 Tax=Dioscorea zingiberensis TaxID=325984 RepID=A0A9D5CBJ7_9LILI|nr:hypothetical protein J5N97_022786 [Dioscorea zingiberensis]